MYGACWRRTAGRHHLRAGNASVMSEQWYWCLRHQRAEPAAGCAAEDRLGPYDSEQAARSWRDQVERRNDAWEDQDERWHGDDRWNRPGR